jgi:hypothetical protein
MAFTKFTNRTLTLSGTSKIVFPDGSEQDTALETAELTDLALEDGKVLVGGADDVADAVTPSGDVTISNTGVTAIGAGKVTPAMSSQAEAVTATADGLTTGLISVTARHITVASADVNHIVTLPASVVGKILTLRNGATGYEIRTTAASSIKINDVVSGSTNELAIPATALVTAVCVSATEWVLTAVDKLGAAIAALVPDGV